MEEDDPIVFNQNMLQGYVYIVKCEKYHKIGYTKRLQQRIVAMNVNNPFEIEHVYSVYVKNARDLERRLHEAVRKYNHRNEWFLLPKKAIKLLINSMKNYGAKENVL